MAKFIMIYHGGRQQMDPDEAAEHKQRYMAWMGEVGSALVSPANPMGPSKLVTSEGVEDTPAADALTGYSVLEVENLDAALEIARTCPFLAVGTLEVAQLMEMNPTS